MTGIYYSVAEPDFVISEEFFMDIFVPHIVHHCSMNLPVPEWANSSEKGVIKHMLHLQVQLISNSG